MSHITITCVHSALDPATGYIEITRRDGADLSRRRYRRYHPDRVASLRHLSASPAFRHRLATRGWRVNVWRTSTQICISLRGGDRHD